MDCWCSSHEPTLGSPSIDNDHYGHIQSINSRELRELLQQVFADEDVATRFRTAPAAQVMHHALIGGLLEHVVSVCGLCHAVAQHYGTLDQDLLIAGAILHDIGKIFELSYDRAIAYTDKGQLLGHIAISLQMLEKAAMSSQCSAELTAVLTHLILSHHGTKENGSPVEPCCAEALTLHFLVT